ncbi:DUF4350 domain-containing protein [Streptomyces sp. P9(2023)]|uniref:DUF4350 domain-containing protein n=1 Tax=Streptomyces sp. P9(2023) TaxID=3064394 RepID=UPI0028F458B4|nr:DUF4350 domain-containing protein [Streptomyces sp. P9(2023)]MDT9689365.1 DUF4350 domain-containing protein [Streptomyces sp. P9(2023)]
MSRPRTSATSTSLPPRRLWTRARGVLLVLALIIIGGVALAAVRSTDHHGRLDPRSADPDGSRAVAEILKAQGVTVQMATTLDEVTTAAGADTTLLVTTPDLLTGHQQSTLRRTMAASDGRTVLLGAGAASVSTLTPGVTTATSTPVKAREPKCSLPAAVRAGSADLGGKRYTTTLDGAATCYPADGQPTLVALPTSAGGDTVLLGSADLLTNEHLDQQGNASLALQLLGSRPHLVWYLPSLTDTSVAEGTPEGETPDGTTDSFLSLVPSGWLWGTLQLALAAVLAAVWRARRLGPLVTEPLPVAIRASEATEGRARLYRKVDARDRAATVLRTATRTRIAPLLGVAAQDAHSPETLLPALSARLPGTAADPRDLLFGPAPADDAALIRLADQLDALEREVRTS